MENPEPENREEGTEHDVSFASVWVKVELGSDEEEPDDEHDKNWSEEEGIKSKQTSDVNPIGELSTRRKRAYKPTKEICCRICDYKTVYHNCYKAHMLGHVNSEPFACELCEYKSKYNTSLQRHLYIKHSQEIHLFKNKPEKLKCDHCDYTTFFKWNLNGHKRKHLLDKQYKCQHCPFETSYQHNLKKHSKVHLKTRKEEHFKCDKCPFVTKHKGHIHRHLAVIHHEVATKAHPCEFCGFSTLEKWRLNIHKQRSKKNEPIKCVHCDFQSEYACQMKKHKHSHFGMTQSNMILDEGLSFKTVEATESMLDPNMVIEAIKLTNPPEHKVQEEDNDNISLNQPDGHSQTHNYTLDPECLDWHSIQVLESDDKERPFQCHMCTYTSKFKASVQRHFQRRHTDSKNRPYKCVNCDFSTKTKDQISLHNKRSQSDVELNCQICDFRSNYKCQFALHQKSHNMYRCSVCSYTSRQKYDLNKHYSVVHMGNGYKCTFCEFVALRQENLTYHLTIHTGDRPFKCKVCDYKASRRSLLENHVYRYHRESLSSTHTIVDDERIESLKVNNYESETFLDDEIDPATGKPYIIIRSKYPNQEQVENVPSCNV